MKKLITFILFLIPFFALAQTDFYTRNDSVFHADGRFAYDLRGIDQLLVKTTVEPTFNYQNGQITKDTVQVDVLCKYVTTLEYSSNEKAVFATTKRMERTFEMRIVQINTGVYPVYMTETKPVLIESRFLDSVHGCFQLVRIEGH